jgi:hypothetical protein
MPELKKESIGTPADGQTKFMRVAKFAFDEQVA